MSINTSIGNQATLEIVNTLCLENGWYFLADENNNLNIGKLEHDYSSYQALLDNNDILNFELEQDDKMIRNRVIVRGIADPTLKIWIIAELSVQTPWNYDANDLRTVVLGVPNVPTILEATELANQLLKETTKLTSVKTVTLAGFYDVRPGDLVYLNSSEKHGIFMVTTASSTASGGGEITTLILEERCPRLFGYYNSIGDVYIGTEDQGVWKKPIKYDHTWSQDSDGIGNKGVTDLAIYAGVYSAVAESGWYYKPQEIQRGHLLFQT